MTTQEWEQTGCLLRACCSQGVHHECWAETYSGKALEWKPEKAQASSSWRSLAWGSWELASQQQACWVLVLAFSNWFWVGRMLAAINQVLPFWGHCCSLPQRPPRLLQSSWVSLLYKVCPLWVCIQALRVVSCLWLQDFARLIQCDTKTNNS